MQGAGKIVDQEAYIESVFTPAQIQKVHNYITTRQIPTQACSLTSADKELYMQAKTQYITATDSNQAAVAKSAFDAMNKIQSRVVCTDAQVQSTTLNSECTNKISILKSQISSLQSDTSAYQKDIARIQKSIDTISQSSDCSINTKRAQL